MAIWGTTIDDLSAGRDALRRGRYGVIEFVEGRFSRIRLRPFPKLASLAEVWLGESVFHARRAGDRCWLYYNQPRAWRNFLALKYVVSTRDGSLASLHGALTVLDWIACLKRTDALLCDVTNGRISPRLLARWGWEPHKPSRWRRHHIKRFYGAYPPLDLAPYLEPASAIDLAAATGADYDPAPLGETSPRGRHDGAALAMADQ